MTTSFSSVPVVDVGHLASEASEQELATLSKRLHDVFATTGFAYLINAPLSYSHDQVLNMSREFFALPEEEKMKLAKRSFRRDHKNTYRGLIHIHPFNH